MDVRARLIGVAVLAGVLASGPQASGQAADPDEAISVQLADLLRAGRSVVSAHQPTINDPALGDKGLTGAVLAEEADAIFAEKNGAPPEELELTERDQRLMAALSESMVSVVDDQQAAINQPGVGFKGFIPAVFARLTNEGFADRVGNEALMRVTGPLELVRNRKSRPDDWELEVIETKFLDPGWTEGTPYREVLEVDGREAFRIMMPEYYGASCLSCHGQPKGEVDITGYPKEGAAEGDLSGAISITIFK
jgi:hypothetical protein